MKLTIQGYELEPSDYIQQIKLPKGAIPLCIRDGFLQCLCQVPVEGESRAIRVVRTGRVFEDDSSLGYVGSYSKDGFDWHVFLESTIVTISLSGADAMSALFRI